MKQKRINFSRLSAKHAIFLAERLGLQARKHGAPYSSIFAQGTIDQLIRMYPEIGQHPEDEDPFIGISREVGG